MTKTRTRNKKLHIGFGQLYCHVLFTPTVSGFISVVWWWLLTHAYYVDLTVSGPMYRC